MGTCQHCEHEITIKGEETVCPNCGKKPYSCWNCHYDITIIEQCPICGYYPCGKCGMCGPNCTVHEMIDAIKDLKYDRDKVIVLKKLFDGNERKSCPENVPISYAKQRLRYLTLKLQGHGVKNNTDRDSFIERYNKIQQLQIGTTWTVSQLREEGTYGQEERDASFLTVCNGLAIAKEINKDNKKFILFERVSGMQCEKCNSTGLLIRTCKKCKMNYDLKSTTCIHCIYKKGEKKGKPYELIERASSVDFCQLPRSEYQKRGECGSY